MQTIPSLAAATTRRQHFSQVSWVAHSNADARVFVPTVRQTDTTAANVGNCLFDIQAYLHCDCNGVPHASEREASVRDDFAVKMPRRMAEDGESDNQADKARQGADHQRAGDDEAP
jgi:hypothetical protein